MVERARVALVTGGSRGIGRAICLRLAADGFDVAVNYTRDQSAAGETVAAIERLGRRAVAYRADVSDQAQDAAMVAQVLADFVAVDVLVANAGIASRGHFVADTDPAEPGRVIAVHALSAHYLSALLLPAMRELPRGNVVLISSTATARAMPGGAPYMMAKAALEALAQTLALEEKRHGIRVNVVAPGLTATDMGDRLAKAISGGSDAETVGATLPFGRITRPGDIAAAVAYLVSADSAMVTGQRIEVDGGQE